MTWTGAFGTDYFDTRNWLFGEIPGNTGLALIPFDAEQFPILDNDAVLLDSMQIDNSARFTLQNGSSLEVSNTLEVGGTLTINSGTSVVARFVNTTSSVGRIDNFGDLEITNGASFLFDAGQGRIENFSTGTFTLAGAVEGASVVNSGGIIEVTAASVVANFGQTSGSLILSATLTSQVSAQIEGDMTIMLNPGFGASGRVYAGGLVSLGLDHLTIDTSAVGALSEGSQRTLITSGSTAMDAFSISNFAVTGQHTDFAYALALTGLDTAVGSLNLYALNDGATGGRAVLEDSATARDITLNINSDTGRGNIRGGSFADLHASLLHGVDEVRSGSGDDILTVTAGTTGFVLVGNEGNDRLTGRGGADKLFGGLGNDTLQGGLQDDVMRGGQGDDVYIVTTLPDTIVEGRDAGIDLVRTNVSVTLAAQVENALATGNANVALTGNFLGNTLTGNAGGNQLFGRLGADTLLGGAGSDSLNGGDGDDRLFAGAGADTLAGGAGSDQLQGGIGADLFVFARDGGRDRVTDFVAGEDRLDFTRDNRITSFNDLTNNHLRVSGDNVVITAGTDVVVLVNVRVSDLDAGDFLF